MKKNLFFITLLFMAFSLIACGNPYMGRLVKKDMTQKINPINNKKHHYVLNHIVVDYDYTIYPEHHAIVLQGTMDDRQQDAQAHFVSGGGWTLAESYLDIYFLNTDRRVTDFCRKSFPLGPFVFPYRLKAKCRFNSEYQYIALSYKYKYTQHGGDVIKIYEHRLDIE
jgi:hypothetical protein